MTDGRVNNGGARAHAGRKPEALRAELASLFAAGCPLPARENIVAMLSASAQEGNVKAATFLFDRLYGRTETTEVTALVARFEAFIDSVVTILTEEVEPEQRDRILARLHELDLSLKITTRLEGSERCGSVSRQTAKTAAERTRCAADIVYWVNTYCRTYDPREADPLLPFHLFPRQAEFLRWLGEREAHQENGLAEKCRDVGFTWLCCVYALHGWLFRKGFAAGFGSRKERLVDEIGNLDSILEKIRFLIKHLPEWMQPLGYTERAHAGFCKLLNPENGASITGEGGDNIGRGGRKTVYFVDEAAFLERPQKVDAALSQTSRVKIFVSTPNGTGNSFYQKRFGGVYAVFTFRWQDDPRKDAVWYAEQVRTLDPVILAQEVDIDYTASVEGVCIPAKYVQAAVGLVLPASGPRIGGLDVADGGKNKTVLIARQGPVVQAIEAWNLEALQAVYQARDAAERLKLLVLHYDAVGVGTNAKGVFNASAHRLPFTTHALLGGESPSETVWPDGKSSRERFFNLRAELWWLLRTRFEKAYEYRRFLQGQEDGKSHPAEEMISLPNHSQLLAELSLPLYFHTETGKIQLESKEKMARRGVSSPDFGDALAYAYAPYRRPANPMAGGQRPPSQVYAPR